MCMGPGTLSSNPDIEARVTIENRDFQCLQHISDVPVSNLLKHLVLAKRCKSKGKMESQMEVLKLGSENP